MKRRGWIKAAKAFAAGAGLGFLVGMLAPPRDGRREEGLAKGPEKPKKPRESSEASGGF